MEHDPYLLIGLGNPGREYRYNRHNFGFMVIDRLIVRLNAQGMKVQSKAIVTSAIYEGRKLILAKPQTYMNLSGQSIQGLMNFYKVPVENVLITFDDLDLPFGSIRLRPGGGAGGQKVSLLRSNNLARKRSRA
jgi:PTH1 family peptidyl-tRNA hydrolase